MCEASVDLDAALAAAWASLPSATPAAQPGASAVATVWGVACSGGRDSMALLHVAACQAARRSLAGQPTVVWALHVNHGLSKQADSWRALVHEQVARWHAQGWPVHADARTLVLRPQAGDSLEALARDGRYLALSDMARAHGCAVVWLAHHRRDQAETMLLQALRGGGVAGLAAMPKHHLKHGVRWARPWLALSRSLVEAHVAHHGLVVAEDDSNTDVRWARNRLRLTAWPALHAAFPQAEQSLAMAAQHQADALSSLAEWLTWALPRVTQPGTGGQVLDQAAWLAEPPALQRQLLRGWFARVASQPLPASWVQRLQTDLTRVEHGQWALPQQGRLQLYRGALRWVAGPQSSQARREVDPQAFTPPPTPTVGWVGEPGDAHAVSVRPARADEWALHADALASLQWRPRTGGERCQLGPNRPARALKKQFQALGIPIWARPAWLLYGGDALLWVPGLGLNWASGLLTAPADRWDCADGVWLTLDAVQPPEAVGST